ncbi:MAG: plastocyanin/azurin family copper-binding protein [Xanthomonadales bacterium]|nr:plastocyanin/azurin family copper-binding protein [Xanthomonadales bacterium]
MSLVDSGKRPAQPSEVVVYFRPDQAVTPQPPTEALVMRTRNKRFEPSVLAVPAGATVRFPNTDPILHNVFSVSKSNAFDMGLYGKGEGKSWTFTNPGLVRVYCNVHQSMVGHVLVLDTPFFSRLDASGQFQLQDIPDGPGRLYVWHERARPLTRSLELPREGQAMELELVLNQRTVPKHKNKFGKSYKRRSRRGRY